MNVEDYRNPRDPYAGRLTEAPNGDEPWYEGLYVVPIEFADGIQRHVVVRAKIAYEGGMRDFMDPVSGEVVGSCGVDYWNAYARAIREFAA